MVLQATTSILPGKQQQHHHRHHQQQQQQHGEDIWILYVTNDHRIRRFSEELRKKQEEPGRKSLKYAIFPVDYLKLSGGGNGRSSSFGTTNNNGSVLTLLKSDVRVFPRAVIAINCTTNPVVRYLREVGKSWVLNYPGAEIAIDKLKFDEVARRNGLHVPEKLAVFPDFERSLAHGRNRIPKSSFPCVVKPSLGSCGVGVALVNEEAELEQHLKTMNNRRLRVPFAQRFVDTIGSMRVVVVGGKVVASVRFLPAKGSFASNHAQGGNGFNVRVCPEAEAQCAIKAAAIAGMDFSGVDLICGSDGLLWVLEINASPIFKGTEALSKKNVALAILDHVLEGLDRISSAAAAAAAADTDTTTTVTSSP